MGCEHMACAILFKNVEELSCLLWLADINEEADLEVISQTAVIAEVVLVVGDKVDVHY
jgi:hypothetical protein